MIELQIGNGESRIRANGELDLSGASEFRDALLKAMESSDRTVLDLASCSSIDLSCMQLILTAGHALSARGNMRIEDPLRIFSLLASECGFSVADLTLEYPPTPEDAHE